MANEVRIGAARVDYTGRDAGFTRVTKKVNRQLTGFEKNAKRARAASNKLGGALAGVAVGPVKALASGLAGAFSGAAIGAFIKSQGELATKMESFSKITGLTITQLQIFQKGMGEFAIGTNVSNKALQTLAKATGEAKRGLKSYQDAFAAIGVSMDELEGKNMQEVLNAVSRGLKNTEDTATRTASAMLLLGGRGTEVAAALQKVNFENKAYVQSIVDTGIVTEKQQKALHAVTAAYDTLGDTTDTLKAQLAAELSPQWTEMINKMTEIAPIIKDTLSPAFGALTTVITGVVGGVADIVIGLSNLIDKIFGVKDASDYAEGAVAAKRTQPANLRLGGAARQQTADAYSGATALTQREEALARLARLDTLIAEGANPRALTGLKIERKKLYGLLFPPEVVEEAKDDAKKDGGDIGKAVATSAHDALLTYLRFPDDAIRKESERVARELATGLKIPQEFNHEDLRALASRHSVSERNKPTPLDDALMNAERGNRAVLQDSDAAIERITEANEKWYDGLVNVESITRRLDSGLSDTFYNAITGASSLSDSFNNLLGDITKMIAKQIIYNQLVTPIVGGISNFLGFSPQARASGGSVNARNPYLVGEKGPELFVPNTAGGIVPNHRMGGGGVLIGEQNIEVKLFDDTGFEARMIPLAAAIKEETTKGVFEALRRPGAQGGL